MEAPSNVPVPPNPPMEEEEPEVQPKEPEIYTASISAVGDVLLHKPVYDDAYIGNNRYDFSKMFQQVKPYLESTDLTIANSESIIGGKEIGLSTYPTFNSPFELGDALKDAGVDVVNMANNHVLDRGERAILNATNHWNELGITYVGCAATKEEAAQIKTITKNNIVFSFLGYTYGTNGIPVPKGKEYYVNYIDLDKMKSDIEKAKEMSDVVVVNIHMGNEYQRQFNQYQDQIAQHLADFGADIVFAHHPHVLQPAKWYTGEKGNQTFVIHSLGNFLSGQDLPFTRIGGIIQLDVKKTVLYDEEGNEKTLVEILNPQFLPTYVTFQNWRNYEIVPLYRLTNEELPNAYGIYEEIKSHMSQYVPEMTFIEWEPVN
ncbi:CapA family protein [Ureibacillus sp. FSL K6-8385]|uniref:CapA family protein n=1 Tax=Ureibacillus terrenus TaxID=118246 RepID=A0A540V156_9BACL|nr:CapA family protein [Ureibacillus terrenus]MED3663011.1 CapA family protein [Ureibacillus terrenus]TQE90455.1 CapA family protein [Ureibacillus terrenus]